jgi:hypothetical protein
MNTTEVIALPKFTKIDASASDKALIQSLRARLEVSEKQLVSALLIAATQHEALLQKTVEGILEAEMLAKKAAKAAKA